MRPSQRFLQASLVAGLLLAVLPGVSRADSLELVSSDANGVTFRLDAPAPEFSIADSTGRSTVSIQGLEPAGAPGRPSLPLAATLVALPPGAGAAARVIDGGPEETRVGVRLTIAGKPVMAKDDGAMGWVPAIEGVPPLVDGPWPTSAVEVGEPFTVRGQRLVAVRLRPVRYDEATQTVWTRRSLTVRVEFTGARQGTRPLGAGEDRHWDPVFERAVLNYDQARDWRSPLRPATLPALQMLRQAGPGRLRSQSPGGALQTAAFDEDNPEVRVLLDSTGVYSLTYANLSAAGLPAGIRLSQLSVHRHEFIPGGNPPYVTFELPIEIDDANGDSVFNANDRIVLFVQNWAERSRASIAQRAWGDAEAVFVTTLTGRDGLRLPARPGWLNEALTPLHSYKTTAHFEQTTTTISAYNPGIPGFTPVESDTNTDVFLWTAIGTYDHNFLEEFPFETNHLDNLRPVTFAVQWVGTKGGNHITYAETRNGSGAYTTVVDSAAWSGRKTVTRRDAFPGTAVSEGRTNALRVWGREDLAGSSVVNAGLNWFEVTYARLFRAITGRLSCNSDSVAGDFQISATGFSSRNIRVYDVSDSLAPVRLALADSLVTTGSAPYTVRFQDSSPTGARRSYVVFDTPKIVPTSAMFPVTRRGLSLAGPADYLLIAPESFMGAALDLAAHRRAQGLRALVCPLESVNDEFNGGRKSSYSIRRLLQFADTTWGARFVLLLGDGSLDPQGLLGSALNDVIPTQTIAGPVGTPDGVTTVYEPVVSDPWYVWCLTCAGGPSGLKLPDMFIGRIPVGTAGQAAAVVRKIIDYEAVGVADTWRRKMLIVADDQYSTLSFFGGDPGSPKYCFKYYEAPFINISNYLRSLVLNEAGLAESDVEVFDLAQYLAGEATVTDPVYGTCRVSWHDTQEHCHLSVTPQMFQRLNEGRLWWNFQGHANPTVLTHEDLYRNFGASSDVGSFANDGKPFLFTAFSCHPNAFGGTSTALGEDMVTLAGKGAIASWASTGYEIIPYDPVNHLNVQFARSLFADPPRDPYLGQGGARAVLGEVIGLTLLRNSMIATGLEAQVGITYNLLGDPATPISIGAPQNIVTANAQPVSSGDPVRLRTLGDTLRIEADLVSNVRLASIALTETFHGSTTTLPPTAYTLSPAFPDTGAASKGGRRFHLTFRGNLTADSYTYGIRTQDRYGLLRTFDAVFPFQTVLRADGTVIGPNEAVASGAVLSLTVLSPAPLSLPANLSVTLTGPGGSVSVPYVPTPANGDTTGREWVLTVPHDVFTAGDYQLVVQATAGASSTHVFSVEPGGSRVRIQNAFAFPNPFDDQRGTYFSFRLGGASTADVQIRVYTVTGRLVYKRTDAGLAPGYRQLRWDGRDAEGQPLANGIYVYRLLAANGATQDVFEGRLVKLRRPRRALEQQGTTP